jgi:hypothetical protein
VIDHLTVIYCVVDDLLKAVGHREDSRCMMSDSEVITTDTPSKAALSLPAAAVLVRLTPSFTLPYTARSFSRAR